MSKVRYPEHEKMAKTKDASQAIGEFLDNLGEMGLALCEEPGDGEHSYRPTMRGIERILAAYFDIDLKKIEKEKRAMIAGLRKLQPA